MNLKGFCVWIANETLVTTSTVADAILSSANHVWTLRALGDAHPDQSLASTYEGNLGALHAAYRFYDNLAVTPPRF